MIMKSYMHIVKSKENIIKSKISPHIDGRPLSVACAFLGGITIRR